MHPAGPDRACLNSLERALKEDPRNAAVRDNVPCQRHLMQLILTPERVARKGTGTLASLAPAAERNGILEG